jgi:dihydropteroate synthase
LDEGAAILDIGGESTRPGSLPVTEAEEKRRVLPLLQGLSALPAPHNRPPLISVDTWRSGTARAALEAGADIINDISGCSFDAGMAELLAMHKPGYILGHSPEKPASMQKAPRYANVVDEVYAFFSAQLEMLTKKGLPATHVALDPGLGFGKTLQHNLALLRDLGEEKSRLHSLGCPVCIGLSRKTLLRELLGLPGPATQDQPALDAATQVFSALLLERGVFLHRVHAVAGACAALKLSSIYNTHKEE